MARQLPPVTTRKSPTCMSPSHDVGASHPFDMPFDLMKALQHEIHSLKASFKAEQQKHDHEVAEMRNDLMQLRAAFHKEQSERIADSQSLSEQLAREEHHRHTEVTELRTATMAALHLRAMEKDHETLQGRVLLLEDLCAHENKAWREASEKVMKDVQANSEGDNDFAKEISRELKELRELSEYHSHRHNEFATEIDLRVAAAAEIMISVGASYSRCATPVSPVTPPFSIVTPKKGRNS